MDVQEQVLDRPVNRDLYVVSATGRLRQGIDKFKANLGNLVKPCLKIINKEGYG